jgi:hypothetical protein
MNYNQRVKGGIEMKTLLKSEKAVKPVVAAIILIAVTVAVSVTVAAWMGSLTFTFMSSTKIEIEPQIYSVTHNFGVLNEDAIFDISIENRANKSRTFNIIVSANENEIFNETVEIMSGAKRNLSIYQKLLFSGLWKIAIFEGNKFVDGYSFVTLTNTVEADLKINQNNNINLSNTLAIISMVVSISVLVLHLVSFWHNKRVKKNKKAEPKTETV